MSIPKVFSFINYKGGVGKTTTTYHIGCSLAQHHNKRVLLIDIDPQTNLTFLCAPVEKWEEHKRKFGTIATIYKKFQENKPLDTFKCIWKQPIQTGSTRISSLDLIPCDIDLLGEDLGGGQVSGSYSTMEALKHHAKAYLRERAFIKNIIREVENKYDYVLIDCPPNIYLMTQNALAASDFYIITAIPDHLSTIGLSILKDKVEKIGKWINSAQSFVSDKENYLKMAFLGGVIFVKVRLGEGLMTITHSSKMQDVARLLGSDKCFTGHTTELIGYGEASEHSVPVWEHMSQNAKRAAKKKEYISITEELIERFK